MKVLVNLKKLILPVNQKFLFLAIILFFVSINSFSQFDIKCLNEDEVPANLPDNTQEPYASKNGLYLPVSGTLRILVVFAEIEYDVGNDPNPNDKEHWNVGELPDWADDLLDPNVPSGSAQGELTRYYQEASFGEYMVLGDYLLEPTNGIFTVLKSEINSYGYNEALCNTINQQMNGNFITGHGLNDVTYFDNWTRTQPFQPKITPSEDDPHKFDHVMFIWRNRIDYNQTGNTSGGEFDGNIFGSNSDTHSNIGTYNAIPTSVARHEYAHNLYGGNRYHTAGGGWSSTVSSFAYDYWIPITFGWSNLGLSGSSLLSWNAWDRQRMNWKAPANTYNPAARDASNTAEVNGDLDASVPSDAGIYALRDFVTTGDAIRIKLPFTDPVTEFPEYLWIENHTGTANNGSPFDKWQYDDDACVDSFVPGMMVYLQIDKDVRQSSVYNDVFGGYANYLRPLTADGFYDRDFETNSVYNECVQWGDTWAFIEGLPNPLTGGCDQEEYTVNLGNPDFIEQYDKRFNYVEKIDEIYYKHLYFLGNSSHIFNLNGNKEIGISTNPSTASMINLVSEDYPPPNILENLRKVYLNGVSIEIISCDSNLNLQVQIRFDDVDVDNDVRWCADEIILSPMSTGSGYSLNLKSGNTILLDQGTTATRMDNPITFNGKQIFISPTFFRCTGNTVFNMESNSTLELDNASILKLEPESAMDVGSGATVDLKNESQIIVQDNSTLTFKSGSFLYLSGNSELIVEPGGILIFENEVNIYGTSADKITVDGNIQIGTSITFQKNSGDGQFYGLVLNNNQMITNLHQVTFNEAQLHNYGAELNITNSTFTDCEGVYSFSGDITVSGNTGFTNTGLYIANQSVINYTATITGCNFTNNGSNNLSGISIWNYDHYTISNNTIAGYYNGIYLSYSGNSNTENLSIIDNQIYNCNNSAVSAYNSKASNVRNYLHNNQSGVKLYNNSNVAFYGNSEAGSYYETNFITDNDGYELYASTGSFPWYFRYNVIIDEDNLGNPTDPMVYWEAPPPPIPLKDVRYNCWGNNFDPEDDLYPGFMVYPTWCPGGGGQKSSELALQDFLEGIEYFENEEYADAKSTFESVIDDYTETQYAAAAMKELFALEQFLDNDYFALQQYYETNDSIQADTVLAKLSTFLVNKCDIALENWQTAIDHFEAIIENPDSPEDSIFAIIDLGYTYFLMENNGYKSSAFGKMPGHKPGSFEGFAEKRNYLLSLLPITKTQQEADNMLETLKAGELLQNIPNPFSGATTVYYNLKEQGNISIKVFDHLGKEVRRLDLQNQDKGSHNFALDMSGLPAGIYFCSVYVNGFMTDTKKMVLK